LKSYDLRCVDTFQDDPIRVAAKLACGTVVSTVRVTDWRKKCLTGCDSDNDVASTGGTPVPQASTAVG
jgi:hypothetical protein